VAHQRFRKKTTMGSYHMPEVDFQVSQTVRAGRNVYLRGATGLRLDGKGFVGKGDPVAQAENAMQVVKVLLEEAGSQMEDICKITTYITNPSHREQIYSVLSKHLENVCPVSTGVVVNALALPEMDFEIDVFAVIPENRG